MFARAPCDQPSAVELRLCLCSDSTTGFLCLQPSSKHPFRPWHASGLERQESKPADGARCAGGPGLTCLCGSVSVGIQRRSAAVYRACGWPFEQCMYVRMLRKTYLPTYSKYMHAYIHAVLTSTSAHLASPTPLHLTTPHHTSWSPYIT